MKSKIRKNKKIELNNVPSNFRNYISEPLVTFSKTVTSSSILDSYLTKNNILNTTINNNFFINNTEVNNGHKKFNSLEKIKSNINPYNKQNYFKEFNLKLDKNKNEKKCLTIYQNKYRSKFNQKSNINNDTHSNELKRHSSYTNFKNNFINKNPFKKNITLNIIKFIFIQEAN